MAVLTCDGALALELHEIFYSDSPLTSAVSHDIHFYIFGGMSHGKRFAVKDYNVFLAPFHQLQTSNNDH